MFSDHVSKFLVCRVESQPAHDCPQLFFTDGVVTVLIEQIERRSKLYKQSKRVTGIRAVPAVTPLTTVGTYPATFGGRGQGNFWEQKTNLEAAAFVII